MAGAERAAVSSHPLGADVRRGHSCVYLLCYVVPVLTVGVRELRQNASALIRLVEQGETVEVTNHGRPVLRMVPIVEEGGLDRLLAEGKATDASGDLLAVEGIPAGPDSRSLSEILAEMREDER